MPKGTGPRRLHPVRADRIEERRKWDPADHPPWAGEVARPFGHLRTSAQFTTTRVVSDVFSKRNRSRVMSRIRSTGNRTTEERLAALFRENGIVGWRRGFRLLGKPDFVFPGERVVVFVDGCFWHGCPQCRKSPRTNAAYWAEKNKRNMARDRFVSRALAEDGWTVVRIWEHGLVRPNAALSRIKRFLTKGNRRGHAREAPAQKRAP